jgi:tRNA threonylcarbamoyladenosine biosynthesis protein TsaE
MWHVPHRVTQMDCITKDPEETFILGREIAKTLETGDLVLLYGGLGAGKTLLTKGILSGLEYDIDEVTSPSFTLVNLYKTLRFDVYHIDLWRINAGANAAAGVGLDEILEAENAVTIIEWADRLGDKSFENRTIRIDIEGDGDEPRRIDYNAPDEI